MARLISQTLTKLGTGSPSKLRVSPRFISNKPQLIEVDLDAADPADNSHNIEVMGLKRLEDAIHTIFVRRLAPDWLPFRPGSSYWVPPKRPSDNFLELVGKLTNPLTEEETLSLSSARGWPSSSFFLHDPVSGHPIPVEVEVQVHVRSSPEKPLSGNEEEEEE